MNWHPIYKDPTTWCVTSNLHDYHQTYAAFSWHRVRLEITALPTGRGLNMLKILVRI
jgi:acetyl-CoA synthetase